jgi:acyl carrier protein
VEARLVNEAYLACIYEALDEANEDRQSQDLPPLEKSPETPIHGAADGLDSLGLINFVVAVEENLERDIGIEIVLSDDRSLSEEVNPFETVRSLADYIDVLVSEQRR